ncbi:M48 family metallopeptidase [Parabacteroides sp. Marseille-P3160]|uniref:tetratricopeptide repeat protein n=1 Tax=Parabacteroides sp. Marseille-P3160 TaxID=1917887 RepID=UPI0009BBB9FA|nr:tetratricopeptide repeat protein [Parabacteroides sp. Marseille-P3160]
MRKKVGKIYAVLLLLSLCLNISAQSLDQAKKLYNEGKYEEAKPAFEKLVKQSPNNSSYNHWYGVCCYETGDFEEAKKHLTVAMKKKVQEAYRYLAEIHMREYDFGDATDLWEQYIDLLTKKKESTEEYEARLKQAQNLLRMVDKTEDVQIIDSVLVNKEDFLTAYQLSEESGTLLPYRNFFEGGKTVESTVYINQKADKIYFGRPDEKGVYSLYSQSRLMDNWGDERKLKVDPSSKEDDNYPYVLSDGVTVYYASKGSGSIGGYDLFVTRYNTSNDSFLAPEQLGMPFNSVANDYMIVIDETKGLGWFVTDRNQPEGQACAYLFIPDPSRKRIESEDYEWKKNRAMLTSIAASWKPGADYSKQVELAHAALPYGKKERQKDFEFIINNSLVYYTLNEINSPEAKGFYEKALALNKQIAGLEKKVSELRAKYTKGSPAVREQLKTTILQAEEQLAGLYPQPRELEKKARNAEIIYLRKK